MSFNGGKDCTVVLDVFCGEIECFRSASCSAEGSRWPAFYVPTQSPFEEVDIFINQCAVRYPIKVERCESTDLRQAFEFFLKAHPKVKAVIVGVRRTDPHCADLQTFDQTDNDWPEFTRIHPILDWSYRDVWCYLRTFKVPYCPLYDEGYTSLGDRTKTVKNPFLQDQITGEYRPAYLLGDESLERAGRLS